jgi:hypothetical protein
MKGAGAFVDAVEQRRRPRGFCWGTGLFESRASGQQCCGYRHRPLVLSAGRMHRRLARQYSDVDLRDAEADARRTLIFWASCRALRGSGDSGQ